MGASWRSEGQSRREATGGLLDSTRVRPFSIGWARPGEGPYLETFHQDTNSGAVVIKDLETIAPLVGEDEKRAGLQPQFIEGLGDDHKSLERLAHIAGFQGY